MIHQPKDDQHRSQNFWKIHHPLNIFQKNTNGSIIEEFGIFNTHYRAIFPYSFNAAAARLRIKQPEISVFTKFWHKRKLEIAKLNY